MVSAFGSGAMFSLVSGGGGQNMASNAVMAGAFFALIQGGIFKVGLFLLFAYSQGFHFFH